MLTPSPSWSAVDARLVADLGFTLVDSSRPGPAGSHLVVAIRSAPTERHFDPEAVAFYAPHAGRGAMVSIDRRTALQSYARQVLWGHVHVTDRLGIENRFLTFGGTLRSIQVSPDLIVLDLDSPGPIVRWGGHSQGTDWLATEIGAFFSRLIVPIDVRPGIEALVDGLPAAVLYLAFLLDLERRIAPARLRGIEDDMLTWVRAERIRLDADPAISHAARGLLAELGLAR